MKRPSPIKEPPGRKKADRPALALPAIVGFVLFSSTLLLCDVSEAKPGERWPWLVDRWLAVPMKMTELSDLRSYAIPCGLAVLLVWNALRRARIPLDPENRSYEWWFEGLALATVAWACSSAWVNLTWEQSRGWVFGLSCGVGWAVLLGRLCALPCIQWTLVAGSLVAVIASGLSLAHRQELGVRFFQLPVGPITTTASLGALWSAIALVSLIGAIVLRYSVSRDAPRTVASKPDSPSMAAIIVGAIVAASSVTLLWAAGRRGAWLGLLAGGGVAAGLVLWTRFTSRTSRALMVATMLTGLAGVGVYVCSQTRSAEKVVSGPLKVRAVYWEKMLEMIPQSPIWGVGPDQFVVKATTALSRRRAEEPTILHGTVDYDGHNEWLQAAFELGLPGGLLYLFLPIGALAASWRRCRHTEGMQRVLLLALMSGLVEVCVAEASSINLRHPILQGWYWTLLGLTMALSRGGVEPKPRQPLGVDVKRRVLRAAGVGAAVFIVIVVGKDIRAALHHAKGRALFAHDDVRAARELELATGRFGAERWLATRKYRAAAFSNQLRQIRGIADLPASGPGSAVINEAPDLARRAVEAWSELFHESPGYLGTGVYLAEAQMMSGDLVSARKTLAAFLGELDPYDMQGNMLQIEIGELDPSAKLDCIRRLLRQEMWQTGLMSTTGQCLKAPDVAMAWPRRVDQAFHDIACPSEKDWKDSLAPETLRIEALRLYDAGDKAGAERVQFAAAQAYGRLARNNASARRVWLAEADAWYWAAWYLFDHDPVKYEEAFDRVSQAEEFIVKGLPREEVPGADPNAEYVGGQVMPLELPERLSPFWRFSAMMHIAMKKAERAISLRINWSLPADQRSSQRAMTEKGMLAAELVKVYSTRPEAQRPPSYPLLVDLAKRYAPRQGQPPPS